MQDESRREESIIRSALGIRYPFDDFQNDFLSVGRITKPAEQGIDCQAELLDYFQARYGSEALEKMMRCLAAASYWDKNKDAFDVGSISVVGVESSLIRGHFITELRMRWCRDDCDWRTYNPSVSEIILACDAIHKQMQSPLS
jgi:hypothetical protein